MIKTLLLIDGSASAERAARHVAARARAREAMELHVLNVQPGLRGDVTSFVGKRGVEDYHREEAEKALAPARAILDAAGIAYSAHVGVGDIAETAIAEAQALGVEEIVMGCRGLGRLAGLIMGSVATAVVSRAEVPVTLVK